MKIIRKIAILFFDILDNFVHQKKILLFFKKKKIEYNLSYRRRLPQRDLYRFIFKKL